jgi:hypothetical protein
MTKLIPPKMQIKWYKFDNTQTKLHIKTNINTETSNDLDDDPINCDDNNQWKFHQIKTNKNIEMSSDLENDLNEYDTIDYWHKELQLIKENWNILLHPNKWLNDQHLGTTMQILYVEK